MVIIALLSIEDIYKSTDSYCAIIIRLLVRERALIFIDCVICEYLIDEMGGGSSVLGSSTDDKSKQNLDAVSKNVLNKMVSE